MTEGISPSRALRSQHPSDGLTCTLSLVSGESAEDLTLRLHVENPSSEIRQFCTYHTPFEGIRNNILIVKGADGSELDYRGKMAKRVPPDKDDFVVLKARASKDIEFQFGSAYQLGRGSYTVQFRGSDICMLPDSNVVEVHFD